MVNLGASTLPYGKKKKGGGEQKRKGNSNVTDADKQTFFFLKGNGYYYVICKMYVSNYPHYKDSMINQVLEIST